MEHVSKKDVGEYGYPLRASSLGWFRAPLFGRRTILRLESAAYTFSV